ncbi:hypothetical protein ERJ75_001325300 [Trypanosoma vivax]|uniref:Adenosine deaminase n=1 Tax=Trypanosoma vivax (strain Y486) TaxID=1055687 RepID=G0U102_TRYVY|nr:hypothetical protein TRVL_00770 [Trypanosoma vivax]KAH8608178.1 hypothetical protein ERJ75_001325300 [Trypanosoma vivax]CCC49757.1 conserved hypothetical protein [Trypanosoma vivax Y486]
MSRTTFRGLWEKHCAGLESPALRDVPKVDLHCHLNGSISAALLSHMESLLEKRREQPLFLKGAERAEQHVNAGDEKTGSVPAVDSTVDCDRKVAENALNKCSTPAERMECCFKVFDNIYKVMNNLVFTRMSVQDLLLHSAAENVFLLEIRTSLREELYETPEAVGRVTKKAYAETVIKTVEHIMRGGVVDFLTGELLPIGEPIPTTWWHYFLRLYGGLFSEMSYDKGESTNVSPPTEASEVPGSREWLRIQNRLMNSMHVRLLLSINRSQSAEEAMGVVVLAKEVQCEQIERFFANQHLSERKRMRDSETNGTWASPCTGGLMLCDAIRRTCWVTGVDLSGNCRKNHFSDFVPALNQARRVSGSEGGCAYVSLGVTLHAGEKPDACELAQMVVFAPERWGHLVFTNEESMSAIAGRHDPIELCLTSNALTGGYDSVDDHHLDIIVAAQRRANESRCPSYGNARKLVELLTDTGSLEEAMRCRLKRRLRRWYVGAPDSTSQEEIQDKTDHDGVTLIPNVSFNTDDRGVFDTTMTRELEFLLRHSSMTNSATSPATSVKAAWALMRLSLLHTFELPLEVLFLARNGLKGNSNSKTDPRERSCDHIAAPQSDADLHSVRAQVALLDGAGRAKLSLVELDWLLEGFDALLAQAMAKA